MYIMHFSLTKSFLMHDVMQCMQIYMIVGVGVGEYECCYEVIF